MRFRCVLIAALSLLACGRKDAPLATPDASTLAASDAGLPLAFTFADAAPSDPPDARAPLPEVDVAPFLASAPRSGKAIGHTSVVFKLELSNGSVAAYKPESRKGHGRVRGEIAARRLARALALPNVPAALPRSFEAKTLRAALATNARAAGIFDAEVVAHGGQVDGALIPWISNLEFLPIETDVYRARWTRWLSRQGPLPTDQAGLAAQISTLVVFDAITGNWDRWSGGNVGVDKASGTLLFIDNDGAFFEPAPPAPLAAQFALLGKIDRYSRKLVIALRALGPIALADAIGELSPGAPLLPAKTLSGVDERRRRVLGVIDAKIAEQGEAAVLQFD